MKRARRHDVSLDAITKRLNTLDGIVARIAADLVDRIRLLTVAERSLEITQRVVSMAPCLLTLVGVGPTAPRSPSSPTSPKHGAFRDRRVIREDTPTEAPRALKRRRRGAPACPG
jgi:hypothetical protein